MSVVVCLQNNGMLSVDFRNISTVGVATKRCKGTLHFHTTLHQRYHGKTAIYEQPKDCTVFCTDTAASLLCVIM